MRRFGPLNITVLALGLAFLYLPIAILVVNSFSRSQSNFPSRKTHEVTIK